MHAPTKKTLYILIACILSLVIISIAKNQTTQKYGLIALETSSSTSEMLTNQADVDLVTPSNNPSSENIIAEDENLTDSFSKSLFAKYYSTGDGSGLNEADGQDLVNQAVDAFKIVSLGNTAHFGYQDLKIVKSTDQNLRAFANNFAIKEEACLASVRKVAQGTQDPLQTGSLYKKCANDFVKISITQEINQSYLNLLNEYYLMGEKISSLEPAKADPLRALVIMKEIGSLDSERMVSYQNISNIIRKSGIIFSNEEPGKAWVGNVQ